MNYYDEQAQSNKKFARTISAHRSRMIDNEQARMVRGYLNDHSEPYESKRRPLKNGLRLILNALLYLVRL